MKRLIKYIFILLPLGAFSQEQLTLGECIALAKENNKSIKGFEYQVKAAEHTFKSTRALFCPNFSVSGTGMYTTLDGALDVKGGMLPVLNHKTMLPTGDVAYFPGLTLDYKADWLYSARVQVKQPIFQGGQIVAGYRMARLGMDIAAQGKRLTEYEVVIETVKAYALAVKAKQMNDVAASYNQLLKELYRSVEVAKKHGMKSQNDLLKVQVKLNESELNLRKAQNALKLSRMNLCHYVGRPLLEGIEVTDELPDVLGNRTDHADIQSRPEYIMLERKSEAEFQKVRMARGEMLPHIGVMASYGYMDGLDLLGTPLFGDFSFTAGLQVDIPIFNFCQKRHKLRAAQAEYEKGLQDKDYTGELLYLEMTQSLNNFDEAKLEYRLAESAEHSAQESMRMSRKQFDAGSEVLSDYLEAQTLWLSASQSRIESKINCYLAWLEYLKSVGRLEEL